MSELRPPFHRLNDAQKAFGGIPNQNELLENCPREFHINPENPYCEIASKMFHGTLDAKKDLQNYKIDAESPEEARAMFEYIQTWLRNFTPSHEDKIAVGGWLLSIMLQPNQ